MNKRIGQSTLEFTVLFAVIVAVFITMQSYVRRGMQGQLREVSDSIGPQFDPYSYYLYVNNEQNFSSYNEEITQAHREEFEAGEEWHIGPVQFTLPGIKSGYINTTQGYTRYNEGSSSGGNIEITFPWN